MGRMGYSQGWAMPMVLCSRVAGAGAKPNSSLQQEVAAAVARDLQVGGEAEFQMLAPPAMSLPGRRSCMWSPCAPGFAGNLAVADGL